METYTASASGTNADELALGWIRVEVDALGIAVARIGGTRLPGSVQSVAVGACDSLKEQER